MEEAAAGGSRSTTAKKKKKRKSIPIPPKKRDRDPLSDCTNAPPSQSSTSAASPIPKRHAEELEAGSADDVAATGSVYTRRKPGSRRRSTSLVPRLTENEGGTLFNYSAEEVAPPPSMLSKSLTEPPRKKRMHQRSNEELPQDFIQKQKAYFAEIDAFELPVEVASSDELD